MRKKIEELIKTLNYAADAYYNGNDEVMSNYEWDNMFDELAKLEAETGIILPDSPTQKVSADDTKGKKEKHEIPALSLAKTKSVDDLMRWAGDKMVNMSWKLDGLTLVLTYDKGQLEKIVTRGNGYIGTNITHLAGAIESIPKTIDFNGKLIVRGEAVISYGDFEQINSELPEEKKFANPRNLASGTLALDDVEEVKRRNVQFIAFTPVFIEHSGANSWAYRMNFLKSLGFDTVGYSTVYKPEDMQYAIDWFTNHVSEYGFPVDGLVISYDDWAYSQSGNVTGHHATRAGYAFKWKDEPVQTVLTDIEYQTTRTGLIRQVAVFKPVQIAGTTVSRATIPNMNYRSKLDLKVGDRIGVIKANMIIPQIVENFDYEERKVVVINDMTRYGYPETCPCCGETIGVNQSDGGVFNMICINPDCSAKAVRRIAHFADRECMNIMGLSEAKIEFLLSERFIKTPFDLYNLSNQYYCSKKHGRILSENGTKLSSFDGWGDKSVKNLVDAIDESRNTDFVKFITAMGIPNVGKGQAKLIKKHLEEIYPEYEDAMINALGNDGSYDLMGLLYLLVVNYDYDFKVIDGIGEVINESFRNWIITNLCDPNPKDIETFNPNAMVINLLDELTFTDKKPDKAAASDSSSDISGKTFVITGDVYKFKNRKELQEKIESLGGKCTGSVSKKTDYLINNDVTSTSGKNQKAKGLGIPVISEDDFLKMIG